MNLNLFEYKENVVSNFNSFKEQIEKIPSSVTNEKGILLLVCIKNFKSGNNERKYPEEATDIIFTFRLLGFFISYHEDLTRKVKWLHYCFASQNVLETIGKMFSSFFPSTVLGIFWTRGQLDPRKSSIFDTLGSMLISIIFFDLQEFMELIGNIRKNTILKECTRFVFCILTHGNYGGRRGIIAFRDELYMDVDRLIIQFDDVNCEFLKGKPKVFIIPCCRYWTPIPNWEFVNNFLINILQRKFGLWSNLATGNTCHRRTIFFPSNSTYDWAKWHKNMLCDRTWLQGIFQSRSWILVHQEVLHGITSESKRRTGSNNKRYGEIIVHMAREKRSSPKTSNWGLLFFKKILFSIIVKVPSFLVSTS